jgi:hypothetical protein
MPKQHRSKASVAKRQQRRVDRYERPPRPQQGLLNRALNVAGELYARERQQQQQIQQQQQQLQQQQQQLQQQ